MLGTRTRNQSDSPRKSRGYRQCRKLRVGPVTGLCSVTRQSSRCGEIRGFATPPRSGCAVSADDVWSGAILASCRRLATTGLTIIQDSRTQSPRCPETAVQFLRRDAFLGLPEVALLNSDSLKGKPIERWGRKASGLQALFRAHASGVAGKRLRRHRAARFCRQ